MYIAFYHYYHQLQEGGDNSPDMQRHYAKQIAYYLEKCLAIQLLSYGKYHSSVLSTLYGLGEAYMRLDDPAKARHNFLEARDVEQRVGTKKDEMFTIVLSMKLA